MALACAQSGKVAKGTRFHFTGGTLAYLSGRQALEEVGYDCAREGWWAVLAVCHWAAAFTPATTHSKK